MQDKYEFIKNLETGLENFDVEMRKVFKEIEWRYLNSDVPIPIEKKMQKLIDLRKDFEDKIHEMKSAVDGSWEQLEKEAASMLEKLTHSVESFTDKPS